jgi:hypothetical protein
LICLSKLIVGFAAMMPKFPTAQRRHGSVREESAHNLMDLMTTVDTTQKLPTSILTQMKLLEEGKLNTHQTHRV